MIAPEHTARPGVEGRRPSPSFDDTTTHHARVNPSRMRGLAHPMQTLSMATDSDPIVIGCRGTTHNRGMRSPSCVDPTHVRRRSSHRGGGIQGGQQGSSSTEKPSHCAELTCQLDSSAVSGSPSATRCHGMCCPGDRLFFFAI